MSTQTVYGEVFTTQDYAPAQEYGSGLHRTEGKQDYIVIVPKTKKALAFEWEKIGKFVILAMVNHPGVPATHFMSKSVDEDKLTAIFTKMVTEALRKGIQK